MNVPHALTTALRDARHVAVLTGAGISAESGLPTFRESQTGLWSRYRPEDLATSAAFVRDPKLVWDWYTWRRKLVAAAKPNAGHMALVDLAARVPKLTLITQNVDGLHQQAGSQGVIELHGNITRSKCFDEGTLYTTWDDTGETPPRCPKCGAYLRPDVVWFGENLPKAALANATVAAKVCDVFLSVGTSGLVQPAAGLHGEARQSGAVTCVVNIDTHSFPQSSCLMEGSAGHLLPALIAAVWPDEE